MPGGGSWGTGGQHGRRLPAQGTCRHRPRRAPPGGGRKGTGVAAPDIGENGARPTAPSSRRPTAPPPRRPTAPPPRRPGARSRCPVPRSPPPSRCPSRPRPPAGRCVPGADVSPSSGTYITTGRAAGSAPAGRIALRSTASAPAGHRGQRTGYGTVPGLRGGARDGGGTPGRRRCGGPVRAQRVRDGAGGRGGGSAPGTVPLSLPGTPFPSGPPGPRSRPGLSPLALSPRPRRCGRSRGCGGRCSPSCCCSPARRPLLNDR